MSKEIREQIDKVKNWNQFLNEHSDYEDDGNDEDDEPIEGEIEYNGFTINYKVGIVDNGLFWDYDFYYIESDEVDEEYIDDNWDDIKKAIIRDLNGSYNDEPIKYKWEVIDTRNNRVIGTINHQIDRKAASEIYDIPKSFIDIRQKSY